METDNDTVYGPQWSHPHPSWSSDESKIAFSSDRTGFAQVYVAELPSRLPETRSNGG
jgi:oligogalacturonide lyase